MSGKRSKSEIEHFSGERYGEFIGEIGALLEAARRTAARATNAVMTCTYWEGGRRIVEFDQVGEARAGYGEALVKRLSEDLTARFGKGFGAVNVSQMKRFYLQWPQERIFQTLSEKSTAGNLQTLSEKSAARRAAPDSRQLAAAFALPWSHYVQLLAVKNPEARAFYETDSRS